MVLLENLLIVFVAGLLTALATGLGALPFFIRDEISDRWIVGLWGLAGGIMLSASTFGLILEGMAYGGFADIGIGIVAGAVLVGLASRVIEEHEFAPREIAEADFKKLILILGVLTVHSFPEGVAVGVSFAEMNLGVGMDLLGLTIPVLAIFMTLAISIQNIPEGLAVSIPLHTYNYSKKTMVGAAVFSSLPQPIGAVIAYYFVVLAKQFLPIGFGFAAGAMILLVFTEMVPEAIERGESLDNSKKILLFGLLLGFATMVPLSFI